MGVLMLAAHRQSQVLVSAEGPDAREAVEAIGALIAGKFEEQE
jgi:phosphocarrier protein